MEGLVAFSHPELQELHLVNFCERPFWPQLSLHPFFIKVPWEPKNGTIQDHIKENHSSKLYISALFLTLKNSDKRLSSYLKLTVIQINKFHKDNLLNN